MKLSGTEVLLVGHTFRSAQCLTDRLVRWGFRCRFVSDLREAWDLLSSKPVDLVLSNTHLSDGTGFSPVDGFARPARYSVPLFTGREQLLLAARN
jgi:DNA-binding response OmpR family regulator